MENFKSRIPFKTLEDAANKMKSLAHPVRLAIIDLLTTNSSLTVSEIQAALNIEQTATSYHLIQMKNKGVLTSSKKANQMHYRISYPQIMKITGIFLDDLGEHEK